MATEPKKITDYPHKGQLDLTNDYIVTNNGTSTYNTQLQKIIEAATKEAMKNVDNVFIMFHRNSDNYPLMVKPHKWPSYQSSGEIAEGVVIVEGTKILVVAPTETSLYWSSANVSCGGYTTSVRELAMADWTGRTSTNAQVTHTEAAGDNYAPGYCKNYSRVNANGQGLTAGRWWLPSLGELFMIYANMTKINYALGLINGATPLAETWYWSSTEYSATNAWILYLNYGGAGYSTKAAGQGRVRAVSAYFY